MRIGSRLAAVAAALGLAGAAAAQSGDILAGTPPTGVYIETAWDGNEDKAGCNWYAAAEEFIDSTDAGAFGADCLVDIRIRGILNRAGARRFLALVDAVAASTHRPAAVVLDSKGGDADAALAIARRIRSDDVFRRLEGGVMTRIAGGDTAVCFSACIAIFAGGYRRDLEFNIYGNPDLPSRLGIHAPGQFDPQNHRYDTSLANRDIMRIDRLLREYLDSVEVSTALVDDMNAVPFTDVGKRKQDLEQELVEKNQSLEKALQQGEAARGGRVGAVEGVQQPFVDAEFAVEPQCVIEARHLYPALAERQAVRQRTGTEQFVV